MVYPKVLSCLQQHAVLRRRWRCLVDEGIWNGSLGLNTGPGENREGELTDADCRRQVVYQEEEEVGAVQLQREEHEPAEDEAAGDGNHKLAGQLGAEVRNGSVEAIIQFPVE